MREKRVLRFYCDFCSKGGMRRSSMAKHEVVCIRNPQRACPVCAGHYPQPNLEALIAALGDGESLDALRAAANGCPACMLSAIVQCRLVEVSPVTDENVPRYFDFNYKLEMQAWHSEHEPFDGNY